MQPTESSGPTFEQTVQCPVCGATIAAAAAFCPDCGSPLDSPDAAASAETTLPPADDVAEPFPADGMARTEVTAAQPSDGGHTCDWCGAANDAGAERCSACGAAFPDPVQEARMLAEAEDRLRSTELALADSQQGKRRQWWRVW